MLKGEVEMMDLEFHWQALKPKLQELVNELQQQYGLQAVQLLDDSKAWQADYPVDEYPTKVTSMGFDKKPSISGVLKGIKGQYLILDTGVVNMRKHRGYDIEFSYSNS